MFFWASSWSTLMQSLSADDTRFIEIISKANIRFLDKDYFFMNTTRVSRKSLGQDQGSMFYLGPNHLQNYYKTILVGFKISGYSYCMV